MDILLYSKLIESILVKFKDHDHYKFMAVFFRSPPYKGALSPITPHEVY